MIKTKDRQSYYQKPFEHVKSGERIDELLQKVIAFDPSLADMRVQKVLERPSDGSWEVWLRKHGHWAGPIVSSDSHGNMKIEYPISGNHTEAC